MTFAQRPREIFEPLETDLRIQLVLTAPPHAFGNGVTEFLRSLGITTVPWEEARRAESDLAHAWLVSRRPSRAPRRVAPLPPRRPRGATGCGGAHGCRSRSSSSWASSGLRRRKSSRAASWWRTDSA
ncbi:hypothetical protein [Streptomyces sp. MBT53]|uniref:hypothetical protein n=1 Tax=Streptomyces sp. MBT53 TaxID=1488384 RepID=UPI001F3B1045|nr:hypothetical protein [Streptomyces sp. MBT53]